MNAIAPVAERNGALLGLEDERALMELATRPCESGRREFELDVPDMRCANCAGRIETALARVPSVDRVRVNAVRHHISLEFDPNRATLSDIMGAVSAAGYTPVVTPRADDDPALKAEHRTQIKRLGVAGIGMMQVMMFSIALYVGPGTDMNAFYESLMRWVALAFTTPVVLYSAAPFFRNAYICLSDWFDPRGGNQSLSMDVPVALAIGIAFMASVSATVSGSGHVYFDSVTMFTFLLLGARLLEQSSRLRLARMDNWLAMLPQRVNVARDGVNLDVPITQVRAGDIVRVAAGDRVPVDGIVTDGASEVDEAALNGESTSVSRQPGDQLFAGTLNVSQPLAMVVTAQVSDTRMAAIARLAQRATLDKPPVAALADKVARHFVTGVIVLALATYVTWQFIDPGHALWATIAVLVVSCPCALSLAMPTAMTASATALRRTGFIATRAHAIESLARITHVVFDKTGTLTGGKPQLMHVEPLAELTADHCKRIAGALEDRTNHPLSDAFDSNADGAVASDVRIHAGLGVAGTVGNARYRLGSAQFCRINRPPRDRTCTTIYLARETTVGMTPLAEFAIRVWLRDDAESTLRELERLSVTAEILTGDGATAAAEVSTALGAVPYSATMSPEAKLARVQDLVRGGSHLMMVGDGINDVPGLAAASVSVAPADGTDLAKSRSDGILLGRGLGALPRAIAIARRTRSIVRQNMTWAIVYNLTAIPLAAAGLVPPWVAAIGMSVSSLGVTLNAARLSRGEQAWR